MRALEYIKFNDDGNIYAREVSSMAEAIKKHGQTYGYVQFWVLGSSPDASGVRQPEMSIIFKCTRDEHNNPTIIPAKYWFGHPRTMDEMIAEGRELTLKFKKLGFSLHDNYGNQLREVELCNIWADDLSTNDR